MEQKDVELPGSLSARLNFCRKCHSMVLGDEPLLKIQQSVIKLAKGRMGMYFNQNIVRSLGLKPGSNVLVSVPSKGRMVVELE